jgi:uncharacterized protein YqgC (DUF456 family)
MEGYEVFFLLAYLLIFIGLIGALLPLVPGPLMIWLGALLWAWADRFQAVGWPTLTVLALLMVAAWGSDLVLTTVSSRRAGAGWKAIVGALVGGIAGAVLLGGLLPLVGSIVGTVLGAVIGILLVQYLDKGNWQQALQASGGYIVGYLAASALEVGLCLLMIAIFAWQAFG